MGLFNLFKRTDIKSGVEKYKSSDNAVLLDVRTRDEFTQGHIPDAINIPLQKISEALSYIQDKNTPVFAYCLSGIRSRRAVNELHSLGYKNVVNIGGISAYQGKIKR
ncbi:MAG: rhodanese-like domain-containing protein [Clostridiales bacterium]|nr:rhodanese-like domain-containing protein [Clostridiales bacterium]